MDSAKYKKNMERLREIEALVKNPETGLDALDAFLEETKVLVTECYRYTRGLSVKVEELEAITPESVLEDEGYVCETGRCI